MGLIHFFLHSFSMVQESLCIQVCRSNMEEKLISGLVCCKFKGSCQLWWGLNSPGSLLISLFAHAGDIIARDLYVMTLKSKLGRIGLILYFVSCFKFYKKLTWAFWLLEHTKNILQLRKQKKECKTCQDLCWLCLCCVHLVWDFRTKGIIHCKTLWYWWWHNVISIDWNSWTVPHPKLGEGGGA